MNDAEIHEFEKFYLPAGLVILPTGVILFLYLFARDTHRGLKPSVFYLGIPLFIFAVLVYVILRLKYNHGWFGGFKE